jgi:hypothetical protein
MNRPDGTGSALPACRARGYDTMQAVLVQGQGSLVKGMAWNLFGPIMRTQGSRCRSHAVNNMGLEPVQADYAQDSGESGYWTYHDSRSAD